LLCLLRWPLLNNVPPKDEYLTATETCRYLTTSAHLDRFLQRRCMAAFRAPKKAIADQTVHSDFIGAFAPPQKSNGN
jgi:hypothetical protein